MPVSPHPGDRFGWNDSPEVAAADASTVSRRRLDWLPSVESKPTSPTTGTDIDRALSTAERLHEIGAATERRRSRVVISLASLVSVANVLLLAAIPFVVYRTPARSVGGVIAEVAITLSVTFLLARIVQVTHRMFKRNPPLESVLAAKLASHVGTVYLATATRENWSTLRIFTVTSRIVAIPARSAEYHSS